MTPTQIADGLTVTQEDREAAKALEALEWSGSHAEWSLTVAQAFARHRETATAELRAENERLRERLVEAIEETMWAAYNTGHVKDGRWSHMFMSDGEWLAKQCGFDPREVDHPDEAIRAAIPIAACAALEQNQ